jgi:dTDP-4-dehydrorhamnose reductase
MPVILLFGAEGQVGWELQRSLSIQGTVTPLTRAQVNLSDGPAVRAAIRAARPAAIVNAAAYTAVDKAESEAELAFAINAHAPAIMAEEAKAAGIPLMHFSTDYAYDGRKSSPYVEDDATNPQSVYARSKLAGDEAILASGAHAVILRTSWVYAARGANFLRTILRLAGEREGLRVVSDQVGAPTSAELLADVAAQVLRDIGKTNAGTQPTLFHCAAAGETSWHGYATYIVSEARNLGAALKLAPENIEAIPTEQYPTPAARPKNSRLDCSRLERAFGLQLPPWQLHVKRALKELLA